MTADYDKCPDCGTFWEKCPCCKSVFCPDCGQEESKAVYPDDGREGE